MRTFLGLLLLALLASLLTGVTQVLPGEVGVVRRFGRVVDQVGPGLTIGLPWGIDRVDRVLVQRVRRVAVGYQPERDDEEASALPGQLLTGDQNLVNLQVLVDHVIDADHVVDYVIAGDRAEPMLARVAEALIAEWVAARPVDEVLLTAKAALPAWLVSQLQRRLDDPTAPYRLGIRVQSASVGHLLPPAQVKADFDAVTSAQTAIRTRENEARQKARESRNQADIERFRSAQTTAARVNELIHSAQAEAAAFNGRRLAYEQMRRQGMEPLAAIWWSEMGRVLQPLRGSGRIDLLDHRLAGDGLDVTTFVPQPRR